MTGTATTVRHATLSTVEPEADETGASTFTKILSFAGFAAAVVVLSLQLKMANVWINAEDVDVADDWMQLLE
jgi:hypothetical protein